MGSHQFTHKPTPHLTYLSMRPQNPIHVEELEDVKRAVLLEVVALATKLRKLPNTKDLCARALEDALYVALQVALAFAVFPPEDASEGVKGYVAIRALEVLRERYDLILNSFSELKTRLTLAQVLMAKERIRATYESLKEHAGKLGGGGLG